jgi:uncharacterized BrkB/YihY/UPF0761 family membrane protein
MGYAIFCSDCFFSIGAIKTFGSNQKLQKMFSANTLPSIVRTRLLGFLEMLGAIGIILPFLLNVYPTLTTIAAACLATVMVGQPFYTCKKRSIKHFR